MAIAWIFSYDLSPDLTWLGRSDLGQWVDGNEGGESIYSGHRVYSAFGLFRIYVPVLGPISCVRPIYSRSLARLCDPPRGFNKQLIFERVLSSRSDES